ncbi:MAG: T9SS type A sorting domain-containing protein [Bacteroidetes bacterium]|nr:T9SS type A sorting domain-containing protein [Bacteroidota bacterium]
MGNIDSYQHQVRGFSLTGFDTTNITNSIITYPKDSKHCSDFYPNPFQNVTQMALSGELTNAEIILFDIFGRYKKTLHSSGNKIILEKREMPTGIYFYQVISNGKILCSGKVVVGN